MIGPRARVVDVRELADATSSAVHAIDVEDAVGPPRQLVLRRYVDPALLEREPDVVTREAQILDTLRKSPVPAPELVASDPGAISCDVPALLMTRLSGRPRAKARDIDKFVRSLAAPLEEIHAVDVPDDAAFPTYRQHSSSEETSPPPWTEHPQEWERAIARHAAGPPDHGPVFIHRDYHPLNVLWTGARVTGIVDWAWACAGPAMVDVAHCRLNLVLGPGVEAADSFLAATGDPSAYDPAWDLLDAVDVLPDLAEGPSALARLDDWVAARIAASG